uniref:C-type lectin domain-containing protein n=2 Tax=Oreochromis aureus TaxID=47969 RepID=A0AAZ1Y5G5_OREAU
MAQTLRRRGVIAGAAQVRPPPLQRRGTLTRDTNIAMKLLTLCALFCAMMAVTTAGGESHLFNWCIYCPDGWTQVGSRCFIYNQNPMSWDSAKRHCWELGANLASVHTYWEHQRIIQLFGNWPAWIGGSKGPKGNWWWNDGTSFSFS